jgi:hypothetical protein
MSHDSRGALLKKGDRVFVEMEIVEEPSADEGYCNANCKTVVPHQADPPPMSPPGCVFNTRMLTRIGALLLVPIALALAATHGLADEHAAPVIGPLTTIEASTDLPMMAGLGTARHCCAGQQWAMTSVSQQQARLPRKAVRVARRVAIGAVVGPFAVIRFVVRRRC